MNKLKKEENIILIIIITVSMMLCSAFLQMHYSSDTYCLLKWGYFEYPSHYFLPDGRLISTLVCYIGGIYRIPYNVYIIGMDTIGVLLMSLSVWVLYKTLIKIMKIEKNTKKIILLLATHVLIFNQFSLEFLLFPESAVMCLGVFTSVLAATKIVSEEKWKYIKIFGLILIAIFSYQGVVNIYFIITVLLIMLKQIYGNNKTKENIVHAVKEVIKIIMLVLIAIAINLIAIKIVNATISKGNGFTIKISNTAMLLRRGREAIAYLDKMWNYSIHMLPKHINSIAVIVTIFSILICEKEKKLELLIRYLAIIICIFTICIVPIFIFTTGVCGRVNVPIAQTLGISLIFLITLTRKCNKKIINLIIYAIVILTFSLNSVMIVQNTREHIAANKLDEETGQRIKNAIEKYEKETGKTVNEFAYTSDIKPELYSKGIKRMGSLTERKFACSWCIQEALEFYCERRFELIRMPTNISKILNKGDYTEFSEEQLLFWNNTLFMLVY